MTNYIDYLSIQSKLILALLLVSLLSILAVSYIGYTNAKDAMRQSIQNQLEGRRYEKAQLVGSLMGNLRKQVISLSNSYISLEGMREFRDAFRGLEDTKIEPAWDDKLTEFYRTEFLPALAKNLGVNPVLEQYLPKTAVRRYLQYHYIAANPHAYASKKQDLTDAATDGSAYSRVHSKYHVLFGKMASLFGYEDVLLVDAESLDVVYSYQKTTDFASNLEHGPYADTNLAQMVRALRKAGDRDDFKITDFELYRPNLGKPMAFIGSAIFDGAKIIGILVFQFPIDEITRVMTGNYQWKEQGLGNTGEVYLVGSDYTTRSRIRFAMENPTEFLKTLRKNGIAENIISQIERQNNSLLALPVRTLAVERALKGEKGVDMMRDYRNVSVLSAYGPLDIESIRWAIIADIDAAEAFEPVDEFSRKVLAAGTALALLTSLIALLLSRLLVSPIRRLTEGVRQISAGMEDVRVEVNTRDEFHELAEAFNDMNASLKLKTGQLREKVRENEELLLNILPAPIAARFRGGHIHATQSFADVTVLIAYLVGFEEISQTEGCDVSLSLMQDLVLTFDEAAEKFGVEKVKTVGSSYLAVCGLSVQRPDNTGRIIEFARELVRIIHRFNRERNKELVIEIGINTGPVVGGIVGRNKFIYDLWGDTIAIARSLKSDGVTSVQVSHLVYERMQDLYSFVAAGEFKIKGKGSFRAWTLAE